MVASVRHARVRHGGALPGWLARRRYGPRLKRRLADKLRAARVPCPDPPAILPLWTVLAGLGGNVVPLRRGDASMAERR